MPRRARSRTVLLSAGALTATAAVAIGADAGAHTALPAHTTLRAHTTARAAQALPPPRFGRTLDVGLVSGKVVITPPTQASFTLGAQDRSIPIGSLINTVHGRIDLRAARPPRAGLSAARRQIVDAQFYAGKFQVQQAVAAQSTGVRLMGGDFVPCAPSTVYARRGARSTRPGPSRLPHRVVRLLWASGKGQFTTKGRYAAASVRGTVWLTADYCDGTLVKVKRGTVSVLNRLTRRTVIVTAGHSYFARAGKATVR